MTALLQRPARAFDRFLPWSGEIELSKSSELRSRISQNPLAKSLLLVQS
jgi:hypothetical protein